MSDYNQVDYQQIDRVIDKLESINRTLGDIRRTMVDADNRLNTEFGLLLLLNSALLGFILWRVW